MKILIVDDDPQVLKALTLGFRLQWSDSQILAARDGDEGLRLFYEAAPDVVLLDVAMPRQNGFEVLKAIRGVSDVPIIMLTAHDADLDQVHGLELGADDYVGKPFNHLTLVARIRAVLRRAELPAPASAIPDVVAGELTINFEHRQVRVRGEPVALTPFEYRVLYYLVRNAGRALPHQMMLDHVWGPEYLATPDHLKVIISRLRAKLDPHDPRRWIVTERGLGYRFVPPVRPAAGDGREPVGPA